jgi:hypothetical protein
MNQITEVERQVLELLPNAGGAIRYDVWRRKARKLIGDNRPCDRLIEIGRVERRGDLSVARAVHAAIGERHSA